MGLNHVANSRDVDPEVVVHENVAEAADLRPGDLGVRLGQLGREVLRSLADDLKVSLDGVLSHLNDVAITVGQRVDVPPASVDRLKDVGYALIGAATHRATASMSADSEIDGLSS